MMWAFTGSQALCAAAKLRIADILVDRPKTAHELAEAIAADEPALLRLLRALTSVDVLIEDEQGRFSATPMGELLRSDHPQSMRAAAIFLGSSFIWRSWTNLDQSIMTGKPAFELVHGERYFEHLANTPEDSILFNAFASGDSARAVETVLAVYDFSGFIRIVDVGGGQGALLRGILESNARATGVLFELPGVIAGTHELLQSAVAPRCEIIGGDMFQSVPPGGDVYILRGVLHDWSDAEVIQILRNCRQAIKATGKLLVLEFVNAA